MRWIKAVRGLLEHEVCDWIVKLITPLEKLKPKRLLDLVFCQIVGDVLENVTPRLTSNDVRILRNTIGEILLNSSLNQLLFQPTAVKRMVIDAAKQCPYYFGRFYAIELKWQNTSDVPMKLLQTGDAAL
ncbi:myosin XV [Echinococcus granulosus]|uniref:Myosin XV n=1 Tax=Echinococcus granulosus TaxID=6210 RepID=W6UQ88_ECHGR|nr:myosin XV [Echinococcus granulosus]EUB55539.1 myosin XV [Echinococcus granulosus]